MWRRLIYQLKERIAHPGLDDVLAEMRRTDSWSRENLECRKRELIANALRNARATPYYGRMFAERAIDPSDPDALLRLPTLSKDTVQENLEELVASSYRGRLKATVTSGSTGTPGRFYRSSTSSLWGYASGERCKEWWEIDPSARVVRLWGRGAQFSRLLRKRVRAKIAVCKDWASGTLNILSYNLSSEEIERHWRQILRWRPKVIHGYATSVYLLARLLLDAGFDGRVLHLDGVIAEAEKLYPSQRAVVEQAFGCPVLEWYGCCEVGVIATPCRLGRLHVREDMVHVEIIDGVIHVTTLREPAAPLLRYRVDDEGELATAPCPCGKPTVVLAKIHGRTCDMIRKADGTMVHPWAFDHIMKQASGIRKYKFVQKTLTFVHVQIESSRDLDAEECDRIAGQIRAQSGGQVSVDIDQVQQIPMDKSGKFRWIASEVTSEKVA
ncbi:MAG: phenylacetate--CoA ligase family protein [Planctomycetes bacterium]|nr:phenylacetate--CoA ligase family protein [Planctomycetota bacterium]